MSRGERGEALRMDMHLHTRWSFDCMNDPGAILRAAAMRGIDRLVITDHDEIDGALELRRMDPERILVGEEVKTREGFDLIGILLTELIPSGTPARDTCEAIRAQGGVVYVPHPFDVARAGAGRFLAELADLVDIVEVHNSRCWFPGFNRRAAEWAERNGKIAGAGSDAHTIREIGRGLVELPRFEQTRESLLAALRESSVIVRTTSSPVLRASSTYAKLRKRIG